MRAGGYASASQTVLVISVVGILGFRGTPFRKPPLYIYPDMEFQPKLRPHRFLPKDFR